MILAHSFNNQNPLVHTYIPKQLGTARDETELLTLHNSSLIETSLCECWKYCTRNGNRQIKPNTAIPSPTVLVQIHIVH